MISNNLGGRPKKVKIELTEESLTDVMTKVFSEMEDVRQKALSFYNKAIKDTRENTSIALVGKTASDYLKIAANATTTKLQVGKLILDHITKDSKIGAESGGSSVNAQGVLNNDIKEQMKSMLKQYNDNTKSIENIKPEENFQMIENREMEKIIKEKDEK